MRLKSNEIVCGLKAKDIRNFLKNDGFNKDLFNKIFPNNKQSLNQLIEEGYIEASSDNYFENTVKGNALAMAKFIKPISRQDGKKIVADLISRAEKINDDQYYVIYIDEIHAFGSFITDSEDLGDIDLYFISSLKEIYTHDQVTKIGNERAPESYDWISAMLYARDIEPKQFLKNKNKYINFHSESEVKDTLKTKSKLIWKRKK